MRITFKEYHQYSDEDFKRLWDTSIFVFDSNTLLNMYRYSRNTVDTYLEVLSELRSKNQLWIPYQVGYEFYENRISVISEYEKSYDEILNILENAKNDVQTKYKDHPFLDLCNIKNEMNNGLKSVETKIKEQKDLHPKWLEKDDILDKLNELFKGNIGINYTPEDIINIKKEGEERYKKKIPPGFKDNQKTEDKKYGDYIIWRQIIDKANKDKKPIILISGDVKEDWWLEKDGKRIMPLPQLKKEMLEKAGVDFHIYTSDRFLEYYQKEPKQKSIHEKVIKEVRKIRELNEERFKAFDSNIKDEEVKPKNYNKYFFELPELFSILYDLSLYLDKIDISLNQKTELTLLINTVCYLENRYLNGEIDRHVIRKIQYNTREIIFFLEKIKSEERNHPEIDIKLKEFILLIEKVYRKIIRIMNDFI